MNLNQLIADLKAISNNRQDLPVQVYDFTDIFQITEIELCQHFCDSSTIRLVTSSQTRKITVNELVSALELGKRLLDSDTLEIEVSLTDGTGHTLAGVEFDRREQTYAITLGTKTSDRQSDRMTFFLSMNGSRYSCQ